MELISINLNFTKRSALKKWPFRIIWVSNSLDGAKSNTGMSSPSSAQASCAEACGMWHCGYVCTCLLRQVLSLAALHALMLSVTCWFAMTVVA